MRPLNVTKHIKKLIEADKPQKEKTQHFGMITKYKHCLYLRCCVQNDILKVAFFFREHVKTDGKLPAYELYISRSERTFITYDRLKDRWLTSKLDRIEWPSYLYNYPVNKKWISRSGNNTIKKYLGSDEGGFHGILLYQQGIRDAALKERYRKMTSAWDEDLAQVPATPKDWLRWVSKVGIPENYIFYEYSKKGAETGYCSHCDKEVPIKAPRFNKEAHCPRCRRKIWYKSYGKAGNIFTDQHPMYLIQRCKDGFVARVFWGERVHRKGEHRTPQVIEHEIRRAIFDKKGKPLRAYYMGMFRQREYRWIPCDNLGPEAYYYHDRKGRVYGKTLPNLAKNELKHTGLVETIFWRPIIDPERYLAVYDRVPHIEQIAKANLPCLLRECLDHFSSIRPYVYGTGDYSLTKLLGIDAHELKRLRLNNGGFKFLDWLRHEKMTGVAIPDEVITWFCDKNLSLKKLEFIIKKMSPVQIQNYIQRQMQELGESCDAIINTWSDYLSMAKSLKMDTNDAIIFRVRKLRQRHDELVARCQEKELHIQAGEILEKYPHVDEICESLKAKYEFADKDYTVVAPTGVLDILLEGNDLHHCVGSSERYWERIERRETYVLFLRRSSEVDKAYYTLEIEPNGTVRQKRTMYDRQLEDIEDATKFLAKWQKAVAERITDKDRELAKQSKVLRNIEFEEMREGQVKINYGDLRGELLVDVLLADLMENAA